MDGTMVGKQEHSHWDEILQRADAACEQGRKTTELVWTIRNRILSPCPSEVKDNKKNPESIGFKEEMLTKIQSMMDEFNEISRCLDDLR